ncbi:MAG: hypothetical protein Q9219_002514 [cf. Caloplaca sp. 3 TL-2023]
MINLALNKTNQDDFLQNPTAILNFGIMPTPYSTHNPQQRAWWQKPENVLDATSDRDATEPHDKIFALLGLMDPGTAARLVVDYDQPCTVIYQAATVCVLESASTLDFLVHAMKYKPLDVPSWCVDFSRPNWNKHPYGQGWSIFFKNDHFASGQPPKSAVVHDPHRGILDVAGSILGRIQGVVTSKLDPVGPERFRNVLRDVIRFVVAAAPALQVRLGDPSTHETLASANLWKTFMNPGDSLYTNPDSLNAFQRIVMPMQHAAMQVMARNDDTMAGTVAQEWSARVCISRDVGSSVVGCQYL